MPGVFISHRRSDSGGWAGRLFDHLSANRELSSSHGNCQVAVGIAGGDRRGEARANVILYPPI
jgi:hypothetical protein